MYGSGAYLLVYQKILGEEPTQLLALQEEIRVARIDSQSRREQRGKREVAPSSG